MKPNFQCSHCGNKFHVPEFTEIIGKNKFKDKNGAELKCPDVNELHPGNSLIYINPKHGIPELLGSSGGTFPSEDKFRKDKQKQRKERSMHHFINDEIDKKANKSDREYFKNKYKNVKRRDHEKM